ncbi:MAG: MarR family transcriptional regulator [Roseibium sp.]|uniref:MarR family winged helix-turn-helix transcriptional regulator n=1 Tax=Roseibium sp. TaxID=1936156 RepID=UPI00260F6C7E|nr:MarR family transcriptional regulator [Roseibium sp.]MCV0427890.1 MarR family transcriptional regulator [Roseibium sp.]
MTTERETSSADVRRLIGEVRGTFRLLAGISDAMLEQRGLTASLRAILEYIADNGSSTVPQMAKAKSMKRQSIQALVDRLSALGLVATVSNPEHKRSVLITMTERGASTYQAILTEENEILGPLASEFSSDALRIACNALADFQHRLKRLRFKSNATETQ